MCLRADATTSAIHVRLILPGECHGDYPPRLCHTPFTRIWPHEELCRFSALDHCSAPFSRACWLALAPPTLLGRGSRHCHGINFAQNGIVGEIAIFRQQLAHHFHGLSTRALNLQSSSWAHILAKGVWHSLAGNLP